LGRAVSIEEATKALKRGFEKALGITFRYGRLTKKEKALLEMVRSKYHSQEWLFAPEQSHPNLARRSEVKITGDIKIVEACHKAKGGLIRTTLELEGNRINDIMITGDFFFIPREKLLNLENAIKGLKAEKADLLSVVENFYKTNKVETPGISPEDFVTAILTATQT
jgi:lipoate-protein ligase A